MAHIADSSTADLPAGTGIIAARMIRRSLDLLRRRTDRSPRKTPPESAFNATQGGRGQELKAQYNRQAAYARRYVNKWPQATAHEYLTRKGIQAAPGCG